MTDMKYLDFDVAIEPTADGYTARVFNSPAGQAAATFSTPFSDLELENFLLRVGRSRHAVRRIESPEMASAKAFGGRLFDQVFTGDVRGCLRSSIDEAGRQGSGLRVRLHLTKVPALADLPWEFLYNANMNRFLSLSVETPLVRYLELPERIRPLIVQPPLHVLMMISSPSDYPQLDVDREAKNMTAALGDLERRGLVTVERQEVATLAELQRRLRSGQYHIFHFVGHGGFDAQADDGLLIMEDQENRGRRVSAQFVGTLLHDHRPLRLAVLNACEGARASRGDPFAGTAQSLVQQGIPAVIAMQFEVTDEAAICFTREFYAAIAVGYPVDAALAEARKAIFAEVSEIEWGTPVLYMRSPDGRVFEIEQVSEATRRQLQMSSLLSAARTAAAANDEAAAIAKVKEVLALEPAHAEASALLRDLTRERELEELYTAARASFDAGQWRDAVDRLSRVQAVNRTYREVQTLIEQAEGELTKAQNEERRRRQALVLRQAAAAAMSAEFWNEAIDKWQALVAIEPDDQQAAVQLGEARRQQELATVYARARYHADRRNWQDALVNLRQLQRLAPDYKDVADRVAEVVHELDLVEDDPPAPKSTCDRAGDQQPPVHRPAYSEPAPRRRGRWLFMGGALGAAAVIAVLAMGATAIALFVADRETDRPQSGTVPDRGPVSAVRTIPPADKDARLDPPKSDDRPRGTAGRQPAAEKLPRSTVADDGKKNASTRASLSVASLTPSPPAVEKFAPTLPTIEKLAPTVVEEKPVAKVADVAPPSKVAAEPPVVTPQLRSELEAAIRRADEAEILAFSTMNAAALGGSYAGTALQKHLETMQTLAASQVFMVNRLHNQRFESFTVSPDGRRAQVRLTEVWSSNFHSRVNRQCISHFHEHDVPQTLSLELTNHGWKIYAAESHGADPQMVACH